MAKGWSDMGCGGRSVGVWAVAGLVVWGVLGSGAAAGAESEAESLEKQLAAQLARNEALQKQIAELEKLLESDVCKNPEAARILQRTEPPAGGDAINPE